jgi:hypothetical protein
MSESIKAFHADPVRSMKFRSEERRQKQSETLKLVFNTPEMKAKQSERSKEYWEKKRQLIQNSENTSNIVMPEETRTKISESLKEYYKAHEKEHKRVENNFTAKSRKIAQYTLDSHIYLGSYVSIRQASITTNIAVGSIRAVLSGRCKHGGGYFWEYSKE